MTIHSKEKGPMREGKLLELIDSYTCTVGRVPILLLSCQKVTLYDKIICWPLRLGILGLRLSTKISKVDISLMRASLWTTRWRTTRWRVRNGRMATKAIMRRITDDKVIRRCQLRPTCFFCVSAEDNSLFLLRFIISPCSVSGALLITMKVYSIIMISITSCL